MISNKKPNKIVTKLFIGGRKLDISTVFSHNFIFQLQMSKSMKIPNKRELQHESLFIDQILTLKRVFIFPKNVQQSDIYYYCIR